MYYRHWGAAAVFALCGMGAAGSGATEPTAPAAAAKQAAPMQLVKDPRALAALKAMSDRLAAAPAFTVGARNVVPLLGPNRQWISLVGSARVVLQRPDKLFVDRGGDQVPMQVYIDGRSLTLYEPVARLYAVSPTAATLDATLSDVFGGAVASFPYLEVLLSDPYQAMTAQLQGALFVGESTIGGVKTEHLALSSPGVDWEIWIGVEDRLPRLVQARYVDMPKAPAITTEFHDWNLKPEIAAGTFTLKKGADAVQIEFVPPVVPVQANPKGAKP